jgi:hypothetical protein
MWVARALLSLFVVNEMRTSSSIASPNPMGAAHGLEPNLPTGMTVCWFFTLAAEAPLRRIGGFMRKIR